MDGNGIQPVMPIGGTGYGDGFGFGGAGIWLFAILALMWGGNGLFGGNSGSANAIQADVNRGFDNQNLQAQTRDILGAVTSGTAQSVAATNQSFHDTLNALSDKYNEITRDLSAIQVGQAEALANQNRCCCETLRALDATNYNTTTQVQKVLDALSANKISDLEAKVAELQLAQSLNGVVRYPSAMTYAYNANPFCGCGCSNNF